MKLWASTITLLLVSVIPLHIHAWCGYIVRNETHKNGSGGGTIEVRIQPGNTESAELVIVPVGEEKELTSHDSPICPNPRLIQAYGTDGDVKNLPPVYYEPTPLGTFHKMVITIRNIGYSLADKTQRKLVLDVEERNTGR